MIAWNWFTSPRRILNPPLPTTASYTLVIPIVSSRGAHRWQVMRHSIGVASMASLIFKAHRLVMARIYQKHRKAQVVVQRRHTGEVKTISMGGAEERAGQASLPRRGEEQLQLFIIRVFVFRVNMRSEEENRLGSPKVCIMSLGVFVRVHRAG